MKIRKTGRKHGYALVSIIVIGFWASMFLMAMCQIVTDIFRSQAYQNQKALLTDSLETGLDYALDEMNNHVSHFSDSKFYLAAGVNSSQPILLPSEYAPEPETEPIKTVVRMKISRLNSTDWDMLRINSPMYLPSFDPMLSTADSVEVTYTEPAVSKYDSNSDGWRVLEITAEKGAFARSARVVIRPDFETTLGSGGAAPVNTTNLFNKPLVSQDLNLGVSTGKLTVRALDASDAFQNIIDGNESYYAYKLSLQSNSSSVLNNTDLQGNLINSNSVKNAPADPVSLKDSTIYGRFDGNSGENSTLEPFTNVKADADLQNGQELRQGPNQNPINSSANSKQAQLAIAPSNSNALPLGDLAGVVPPVGSTPPSSQAFTTNYLSTNSDTNVEMKSGNPATQIFVEANPNQVSAVDLNATYFSNNSGDARNLQIYYNGTKPINIDLAGKSFSGIIYAPNAPINITSSSTAPSTFNGALVGKSVNANYAGSMNLMNEVSDSNSLNSNFNFGMTQSSLAPNAERFKAVTWQEMSTKLVSSL